MKDRVRSILADLERVRKDLRALSNDIWSNIDHNDPEALRKGFEFKQAYNDRMEQFNTVANGLSSLLQPFASNSPRTATRNRKSKDTAEQRPRITRELDRTVPHTLNEDFTHTDPFGFSLRGQKYGEILEWRRLYEIFCQLLAAKDPTLFRRLPSDPAYIGKRGRPAFSTMPDQLRAPIPVLDNVYAEGNLSANDIRNLIKRLLATAGIDQRDMLIYLSKDHDAPAES